MKWNELFVESNMPSYDDIKKYLGEACLNYENLCSYLEEKYSVKSKTEYSKCSAQPGWNIKYKKGGKSLCTLYPMEGYFIALVVVGSKEKEDVENEIETGTFTPYVAELYKKSSFSALGIWLMIEIRDSEVLNDIKTLIAIRLNNEK